MPFQYDQRGRRRHYNNTLGPYFADGRPGNVVPYFGDGFTVADELDIRREFREAQIAERDAERLRNFREWQTRLQTEAMQNTRAMRQADADAQALLSGWQTGTLNVDQTFKAMEAMVKTHGQAAVISSPAYQELAGIRQQAIDAAQQEQQEKLAAMQKSFEALGVDPTTVLGMDKEGKPIFSITPTEQRQLRDEKRRLDYEQRRLQVEEYERRKEMLELDLPEPGRDANPADIETYRNEIAPMKTRILRGLQRKYFGDSMSGDGLQVEPQETIADVPTALAPKQFELLSKKAQAAGIALVVDEDDYNDLEPGAVFIDSVDGKRYKKPLK